MLKIDVASEDLLVGEIASLVTIKRAPRGVDFAVVVFRRRYMLGMTIPR